MIGRRFFVYFVVVTGILVLATAGYVHYSLGRAVEHALAQNLLFARSTAQYLGGRLEEDGRALQRGLAALPEELEGPETVAPALAHVSEELLGRARVAILDSHGHLLGGNVEPNGLAPSSILLPAMRRAREGQAKGPIVTDLWKSATGTPHVCLVVAAAPGAAAGAATPPGGAGPDARFAVAQLPLDSEEFIRVFGYFLVAQRATLQLLDSSGNALFSTRPADRFRSAVHGTFFVDKVRLGEPAVMNCHSCHLDQNNQEEVAERMVTTVAPVPNTSWAIAVLENERDVYATMREIVLSSIGLVILFFGGFAAFYLLLSRRVLRPMRDLARAAAAISSGQAAALPFPDAGDELSVLAHSFEAMQRRASEGAAASGVTEPGEPVQGLAAPELSSLLEEVVTGLTRLDAVKCAGICVSSGNGPAPIYVVRGLVLRSSRPLYEVLAEIAEGKSWVALGDLTAAGVEVEDAGGTVGFHVRPLSARGSWQGFLWIGTDGPGGSTAAFLSPAVDVLARQVESLLERSQLFERLRQDHELKGQMLRRLFDAEDQERRRIARELHDETAQLLTSLLLHFATFPPPEKPAEQEAALGLASKRVKELLEGIHRLIHRLRPALLDDLGLAEALRALGRNVLAPAGVEFDLAIDDDENAAKSSKEAENAVFRVFQEAATNVLRHSGAKRVEASLLRSASGVKATFEDDGTGTDLSWMSDAAARPRWGILGMRERITQIGGKIRFARGEGGGLRIEIEVPSRAA